MTSYTYIIENTSLNHPTAYVGKANDPYKRFVEHFKEAHDPRRRYVRSHFCNALRKYGVESFKLHVVESCSSEIEAFEQEREWISYLKSMGVALYNKSPGGYGGEKRATPEETRRKQSETHKRRQESQELRCRISEKLKGRVKSDVERARIATSKRKPVQQLSDSGDIITTFESALEAQRTTGISRSGICDCCKGRKPMMGGFAWRYA